MSVSNSATRSPRFHHCCPDCLWIDLDWQPAPDEAGALALALNLRAGEPWQSAWGGRVKFALARCSLTVAVPGATAEWVAAATLDGAEAALALEGEAESDLARWAIAPQRGTVLAGTANGVRIGLVRPQGDELHGEVRVLADRRDVRVRDADNLWPHTISPNQHAVLDRKLARVLWERLLSPTVSRGRLHWRRDGRPEPEPEASDAEATRADRLEGTPLHDTIAAVLADRAGDFLTLAARAGLDPAADLAGGNLMAATLSGLDLSGADLRGANLRGAELCDADLSGADLSGARLQGADLSGAYLSDTNLNGADLHRASLALANLGGADLRDANLREANLSQANFHSTQLAGAVLAANAGLTAATRSLLQESGARLED